MPSLLADRVDHPGSDVLANLTEADRQELLRIARVALEAATGLSPGRAVAEALSHAREGHLGGVPARVFVSLRTRGDLRGCMGALEPLRTLPAAVADASLLAARVDPRFWPLQADELPAMSIEISVLGPLALVDDPESIRLGTDGVMVERGGRRALLLPQVATDQGWGAAQLWSAVCQKAGLPPEAWRHSGTSLQVFETLRFGGPACQPEPGPREPAPAS